ncbi:hypothetical protein COLO4_03445 [Corchorus olitorius]|uniref:Pentatricopeptide repeat-containing protein n=1 Tax=Corchorus olitorius TaxID=93759 RepID=A0A1R3KYJ5_9ROSI|nr:hypothetical protein COLO4_03445 [Corchorus olitorius]
MARNLFDEMPMRTVVSWNTMISGYSKWGKLNESLDLLSSMHRSDIKFNESTYSTALSVCGRLQSSADGKQIHCIVIKSGCESFELVGSALLYFYATCFEIAEGKRVFDELHEKNELLWNLLIAGYVECNMTREALDVFRKMPKQDVVAWTTLISGYAKSEEGCEKALELFWWMRGSGESTNRAYKINILAWTALINAYAHHGPGSQAILLFEQMLEKGVAPNGATFVGILSACGRAGLVNEGMGIFRLSSRS